jgi:hypothetical protein
MARAEIRNSARQPMAVIFLQKIFIAFIRALSGCLLYFSPLPALKKVAGKIAYFITDFFIRHIKLFRNFGILTTKLLFMKKLLTILILMAAMVANAQQTDNTDKTTPGDELIIASKTYYAGIIVMSAGVTGILVGQFGYNVDDNDTPEIIAWKEDTKRTFTIVGSGVAAVGVIIQITAFSHIGKAGRKLNAISGKDGIGISMKF